LGLRCEDTGLSLAGAPLLRASIAGFAPRQNDEIGFLIKAAYGREIDASKLPPRLGEIAGALNRGDLGRAMIAAVHLRLPDLSWAAAVRIAKDVTSGALYNPLVGEAVNYHANYVRPYWASTLQRVDRIGNHIFYKLRIGQN